MVFRDGISGWFCDPPPAFYTRAVFDFLDIRDELERSLEPLELFCAGESLVWTLAQLENGDNPPLELGQAIVVICNLGLQSALAAYYLQAEGYAATSLEGGIARLRKQRENHFVMDLLAFSNALEVVLQQAPRVRQFSYQAGKLEVRGMISWLELQELLNLPEFTEATQNKI
jgi:rhodanese-related sulfurtransferase